MSQVKKIIVDSRYFVNNAPAGKGTFELSEIVEIHGSQVLYLESFQCANSWFTVDDSNCNLYIIEQGNSGLSADRADRDGPVRQRLLRTGARERPEQRKASRGDVLRGSLHV